MTKKQIVIILGIQLVLLIISCGNDDVQGTENEAKITVAEGRAMQVSDLYDNQIKMLQTVHVELVGKLVVGTEEFIENPSEQTLINIKNIWENSFLHWKKAEIYNLGVVQNSFIHTRIHQWPINTCVIERNIESTDFIDSEYIAKNGANSKGYGAIEYMIYRGSTDMVLSEFISLPNYERRGEYLLALAKNLNEEVLALQKLWEEAQSALKSNLETGVNGSQNQMVNALIAALESIKNRKIEEALNSENEGVEKLEVFRSMLSKEAIVANLNTIQESYTGDYVREEGFGLASYTTDVLNRPELDNAIQEAIQLAISNLNQIEGSLEMAVENDIDAIETFRESIQEVIAIFKTDFSSAANIVVTFNDNDGD
ncbi:imelysin family protein [Maribacter sp. 2210JD10-5]|uniref:imelysin family protein n=1 Tax=Maribacter sp. 2210JD10-5 TaxID=3386272 RepID=UPI0039BC713D